MNTTHKKIDTTDVAIKATEYAKEHLEINMQVDGEPLRDAWLAGFAAGVQSCTKFLKRNV